MSDTSEHKKLSEVLTAIRNLIEKGTQGIPLWVTAEIANISTPKSGHAYLDLTESNNGRVLAQCRAVIWQYDFFSIKSTLGHDWQNILKQGNEVLFQVVINFSEVYGFQLHIKDVDISFSLGNLEKKKQKVIQQLTDQCLVQTNKYLEVLAVIQKIALIGSPKTSGYADFIEQLSGNQFGYEFNIESFPCSVQGIQAEKEIIEAFDHASKQSFDVVVLLRGGGSKLDLEVFNSYQIARTIAEFNHPVWTGIGHETDFTVSDLVANQQHKTPTALASHIIEMARSFEVGALRNFNEIANLATSKVDGYKRVNDLNMQYLKNVPIHEIQRRRGDLQQSAVRLMNQTREITQEKRNKIDYIKVQLPAVLEQGLAKKHKDLDKKISLIDMTISLAMHRGNDKNHATFELIKVYSSHKVKEQVESLQGKVELIKAIDVDNTLNRGFALLKKDGTPTNTLSTNDNEVEIQTKDRSFKIKIEE